MNQNLIKLSFTLLIFMNGITSHAQDSLQTKLPKDTLIKSVKKNTLVTGMAYTSKLHYYGRTDSLSSSAFIPTLLLSFKNGFYLSSNVIFINNSTVGIEYAATTAGVGYRSGNDQGFVFNISADKFFYESSSLVQSAVDGQAAVNFSYLDKILNFHTGFSTAFSENIDLNASASLDHTFRIKKNKVNYIITPSFTTNAGTQNYSRTYYKNIGIIPLPVPGTSQEITESSKRFTLLSYELALPVIMTYKKFIFNVTPSYILPQNLVAVPNRPDLSEKGNGMFYVIAAAFIKLDL